MIITCPECATRYDVEDARFQPKGRSVRCSACGESWFVEAPEPVEELEASARIDDAPAMPDAAQTVDAAEKPEAAKGRIKLALKGDDDPQAAPKKSTDKTKKLKRSGSDEASPDMIDEVAAELADDEDDDSLFETPVMAANKKKAAAKPSKSSKARKAGDSEPDDAPAARRSRNFRDSENRDETSARPRRFAGRDRRDEDAAHGRPSDAFVYDDAGDDWDRAHPTMVDAEIVDADWEDVDDYEMRPRGFGRRVRAERRRATALARMEDVRRFDPEMFDEQFFDSLRVTPRELERAVRKARRRAEARDKNRLTPWRAFGWSAWVAAMAGVIYALVVYREEIVQLAPSTAEAYAVVGIKANPTGLQITDVSHRLAMSTGGPTVEITGSLSNPGQETQNAPLLQAEALGARGELLSRWTFTPEAAEIAPAGAVKFITRAGAPEGVVEVALSFAPDAATAATPLSEGE